MNEGLELRTLTPVDTGYRESWLTETKRMVERGFDRFCKKRGLAVNRGGMARVIRESARTRLAQKKVGL